MKFNGGSNLRMTRHGRARLLTIMMLKCRVLAVRSVQHSFTSVSTSSSKSCQLYDDALDGQWRSSPAWRARMAWVEARMNNVLDLGERFEELSC